MKLCTAYRTASSCSVRQYYGDTRVHTFNVYIIDVNISMNKLFNIYTVKILFVLFLMTSQTMAND